MNWVDNGVRRLQRTLETVTGKPQVMFFLPAALLTAYVLGGEGAMIAIALAIPAAMGISGVVSRTGPAWNPPRDAETGLVLRKEAEQALTARLLHAASGGKTAAVLVLGIDNFAETTSNLSPSACQSLLRQCGDRLTQNCREGDIVAALSQGKFALALAPMRRADLEVMIQLSARLQLVMAEPFVVDGLRVHLTVAAGFCLPGRAPSKRGADMMRAAELALAEALNAGPGGIRSYAPDMAAKAETQSALEPELSAAFEARQIEPVYWPQASTETGMIIGLAAAPRWLHPERGPIAARDFMHLVAEQNAMARLDDLMVDAALRQLKAWDKAEMTLPAISIRLHGASLSDPQLTEKLLWAVDRYDLTPDRLRIELPEGLVTLPDNEVAHANLRQIGDAGFSIDLCGFGTGHAALSDLRRAKVARIKIDDSFIARVDRDREQQNMVAAILTMAEKLSLSTVACGVGTTGEHAMLAQLGCAAVEGHVISGPLSAEALCSWLADYTARLPAAPKISARRA